MISNSGGRMAQDDGYGEVIDDLVGELEQCVILLAAQRAVLATSKMPDWEAKVAEAQEIARPEFAEVFQLLRDILLPSSPARIAGRDWRQIVHRLLESGRGFDLGSDANE
jgi:hypothetical protein